MLAEPSSEVGQWEVYLNKLGLASGGCLNVWEAIRDWLTRNHQVYHLEGFLRSYTMNGYVFSVTRVGSSGSSARSTDGVAKIKARTNSS